MSIQSSLTNWVAALACEAFIGGRRMTVLSGSVDLGFDGISSSCDLLLPADPGGLELRQEITVWLGWDGRTQVAFTGFVEGLEAAYDSGGFGLSVRGSGYLQNAQLQYYDEIAYTSLEDEAIVDDLLTQAGIGTRSIDGDSEVLGVVQDVVHQSGSPPWSLINEIDDVLGYKTFDGPDGVVRRRKISGNPPGSATATYTEGQNIYRIGRPRNVRGIYNAVRITGLEQVSFTPESERFATNPLVPIPPTYVMFTQQSDLIETADLANRVSDRKLQEVNRVLEVVPIEIKGDPRRVPGEGIRVISGKLGLSSGSIYWLRHVRHQFDSSGFTTTLTLEGGIGTSAPSTNISPEPVFSYILTRETFVIGGTPTDMWTVTCDGTASYDLDGTIAVYAWANNKNSDVSSTPYYSTAFTTAQIGAAATITLTVTDDQGAVKALTQTIAVDANRTMVRGLYIAAGARAEATADGGKTWATWTPGAGTVLATPTIAGALHSYFGLSDGKLYRTDDYLDTAPTLVHDFGSQVNTIWINEANANRVTVGLNNGEIWRTTNADLIGSSTWTLLTTYGAAVLDLVESRYEFGQYRVSIGATVRITYTDFATDAMLITFASTARQIIPSLVGLPGKATGTGTGPVKSEDGTTYTYATSAPTDVHAGTHHIRQAVLLVIDRAGEVWKTEDAGTEFTNIGQLGTGDPANRAIRDGDNQEVFYVGADDGAWKTYDGGLTWLLLRDYAGGSLFGRQIGYGDLQALGITDTTIISEGGVGKVLDLWNAGTSSNDPPPANWRETSFDDTSWAATVAMTEDITAFYLAPTGAEWISDQATGTGNPLDGQMLTRHEFSLPSGIIAAATIEINADDYLIGLWINNIFIANTSSLTFGVTPRPATLFNLAPSILLPGQTNIITAWFYQQGVSTNSPIGVTYKLVVT